MYLEVAVVWARDVCERRPEAVMLVRHLIPVQAGIDEVELG
jgi:hypothetical protein